MSDLLVLGMIGEVTGLPGSGARGRREPEINEYPDKGRGLDVVGGRKSHLSPQGNRG